MYGYKCAKDDCELTSLKGSHFCWNHADPHERRREPHRATQALPEKSQATGLDTVIHYETPGEEIERLLKENLALKQEAGKWKSKYDQLNIIYNKLADQWNVFQASSRPDNRNIQRAEGAGEMARKLAEVLLCLAYDTDSRDLILELFDKLGQAQNPASGQEVEVGGKLVRSPHRG